LKIRPLRTEEEEEEEEARCGYI